MTPTQAIPACMPLVVDAFATFPTNTLGGVTSDDGTMSCFTTAPRNGGMGLNVCPRSTSSYWYETGMCTRGVGNAIAGGWAGLSFNFVNSGWDSVAPASFAINLQTGVNNMGCTGTKNSYYSLSTRSGLVRIPFSMFPGANLNNIVAISFEGLGPAQTNGAVTTPYSFGPISFYCL